jgi:hypothetical protein
MDTEALLKKKNGIEKLYDTIAGLIGMLTG